MKSCYCHVLPTLHLWTLKRQNHMWPWKNLLDNWASVRLGTRKSSTIISLKLGKKKKNGTKKKKDYLCTREILLLPHSANFILMNSKKPESYVVLAKSSWYFIASMRHGTPKTSTIMIKLDKNSNVYVAGTRRQRGYFDFIQVKRKDLDWWNLAIGTLWSVCMY